MSASARSARCGRASASASTRPTRSPGSPDSTSAPHDRRSTPPGLVASTAARLRRTTRGCDSTAARRRGRARGDGWRALPRADDVVDARRGGGCLLTPGFIDIHGHGGGGASLRRRPGSDPRAARACTVRTAPPAPCSRSSPLRSTTLAAPRGAWSPTSCDDRPRRSSARTSRARSSTPPTRARTTSPCCARRTRHPSTGCSRPGAAPSARSPWHPSCRARLDAIRRFVDGRRGGRRRPHRRGCRDHAPRRSTPARRILTHAFNAMPRHPPPRSGPGRAAACATTA